MKFYYIAYMPMGANQRYAGNWLAACAGELDIARVCESIEKENKEIPVVTFWKEISETEHDKLALYFDKKTGKHLRPIK